MVQMHCKRCGANEDRINGFCSVECEEYYRLEEEINALDNVILERGAEIGRLNARIIEVTHLYLQTKDAFNLVTEILLKQDARIAELELSSVQIQYMSEDELPKPISYKVYSAMYPCSKVDFVRMFPFVMVDGDKCFLIKLPEREE